MSFLSATRQMSISATCSTISPSIRQSGRSCSTSKASRMPASSCRRRATRHAQNQWSSSRPAGLPRAARLHARTPVRSPALMRCMKLHSAVPACCASIRWPNCSTPQSGDRLAILTNGGGPGVMAADAVIAQGGRLATLSPTTVSTLDAILPRTWSRGNPVDIIGDAPGRRYADTLAVLMEDEAVDAVLVLNCPTALGWLCY
jgi:hypothetical protein